MFHVKHERKKNSGSMRLKEIKIALVVTLTVGLLAACGQSDAASQENTENVLEETTAGEVAEEEGNASTAEEETGEGTSVLTEVGTTEKSEADAGTEESETEDETEELSMAGITPVRIYGVISEIWADQNTIVVDNQSDASSPGEIELKMDAENTLVLDATTGYPVSLEDVQTGSFEAYLGGTMTMSLPPQTTPYVVIVNIPEDYGTPQYAIVEQIEKDGDGGATVTATDGRSYVLSADTQIVPYRTKNIVTIDDIQAGMACLIWLDEDGTASKVQIFQ